MLKPVELEIELFCRGLRMESEAGDGRPIGRTRAGLGSGLELILTGGAKPIWVNVPVVEAFARKSPFVLRGTMLIDERDGAEYPVGIPPEPRWYTRFTSSDVLMSRIGVLQGNYLGIYIGSRCGYWTAQDSTACRFCTTGSNVGTSEEARKSVEDVIEVARAARNESNCVFTHFNTGYHFEERNDLERTHGLRLCEPYVRAVRQHVGGFIGVQAAPVPRSSYYEYDALIDAGTDHFSFCYEFEKTGCLRRALSRQGAHARTARVFRSDGVHGAEDGTRTCVGRDHRRRRADRRHDARNRPDRRRGRLPDDLHLPSDRRQCDGARAAT